MPAPKPSGKAASKSAGKTAGKATGKATAKRARNPGKVYQLKVSLNDLRPAVWRRLLVRETCTLARLHTIIQIAMGWEDCHLHLFTFDGRRFGNPRLLDLADLTPETIQLRKVLTQPKQRMFYTYDFGDNWHHQVVLEAILEPHSRATFPKCVEGARACPPEDVGGPPGYSEFLKAMRNPRNPNHRHYLAWNGGRFDPEHFPITSVNKRLQPLKR